jgi:hypothetical protein
LFHYHIFQRTGTGGSLISEILAETGTGGSLKISNNCSTRVEGHPVLVMSTGSQQPL